ncbi:MAG: type II toxin-antitoxin system HicB family antitoxin [Lachnospiraceae bacterium]|nr:type II toxin-antitoxin system HicB family antitoxin [Lachnospiraceae bacterium]
MLTIYPACFFKEEKGYSVVFPDLNWLATQGKNENDAMKMAVECLAEYLYFLEKMGEKAPKPSEMKEINLNQVAKELDIDVVDSFVNLVSVNVSEYAAEHFEKSVKKTLTIPVWLNSAAQERNINFSQTLQEALIAKIKI